MYSKLVQLVSQDLQEKVKYMNREEDLNEPGLRRSKRGYKPIGYIEKNQVKILD